MITLGVVMSEQCNLDCGYCGMDKRSTDKIDPKEFIKDYKLVREENPEELIKINFFGGEPLLQFDMIQEIMSSITDKNVEYGMPTNGINMTPKMVDYFNQHNVLVSISFDGLWQGNNRPLLSGADSKNSFDRKIDVLKKLKFLKSHTMIGDGNYNLLENWLFIKDKIGTNSELTLIRDRGVWSMDNIKPLIAGIDELFEWYEASDGGDMPQFILFYFRHFLLYETKQVVVDSCGAGKNTLFYSNDKIVPCVRFNGEEEAESKIEEFREMDACKKCSVRNYCKKGCLFEQIKNNEPIEELCIIYRHIYNRISAMVGSMNKNNNFLKITQEEVRSEMGS
jgi:radical SAM protein with 4Fe4S-binding SPASM domain